jgi:hypothetical protein
MESGRAEQHQIRTFTEVAGLPSTPAGVVLMKSVAGFAAPTTSTSGHTGQPTANYVAGDPCGKRTADGRGLIANNGQRSTGTGCSGC